MSGSHDYELTSRETRILLGSPYFYTDLHLNKKALENIYKYSTAEEAAMTVAVIMMLIHKYKTSLDVLEFCVHYMNKGALPKKVNVIESLDPNAILGSIDGNSVYIKIGRNASVSDLIKFLKTEWKSHDYIDSKIRPTGNLNEKMYFETMSLHYNKKSNLDISKELNLDIKQVGRYIKRAKGSIVDIGYNYDKDKEAYIVFDQKDFHFMIEIPNDTELKNP